MKLAGVDTYDLLSGLKPIIKITVRFEPEPSSEAQAVALLAFERQLRQLTGLDCRVFKERMGDDSKLRVRMTPAEREHL